MPCTHMAAASARAPAAVQDWRLYIIQELADGGPLGNLYGHPALWLSPGVVNLVRGVCVCMHTHACVWAKQT